MASNMTIESLLVVACIIFLVTGVDGASGIHFASSYGDHMVLQGSPYRSVLWGFAHKVGDAVHVSLNNAQVATTTVTANHHGSLPGIWKVKLPVQHHKGPVSIQVSSSEGSATLHDVLFGDVWFCSGQSNMGFPMGQVFNNTEELKQAPSFTEIRTFQTALTTANTSHTDLLHSSSWNLPSSGSLAGFSAVCWLYGKYLYPHIHRPIGLIESAWGGTPIESWSSHEALATCTHNGRRKTRAPSQPSVLWNAMVNPFVQMTIFGAIWYQGESNAGRADKYACQFSAMINDWRQKFHKGSDGETNSLFPFGFVQLSGFNNNFNNIGGFPDLRWAQTANYGFVPNAKLQNVFMAVAMDLPDFTSPYGPIHPRDKEDVASRLVFAGRAVAYGEKGLDVQGPFPSTFNIHGSSLVIEFNHGKSPIEVRSNVGFELAGYNRDPSRIVGFPDLRWTQTANYRFVPNVRLQNVMYVTMDLPDFNSTYGAYKSPHGRSKGQGHRRAISHGVTRSGQACGRVSENPLCSFVYTCFGPSGTYNMYKTGIYTWKKQEARTS